MQILNTAVGITLSSNNNNKRNMVLYKSTPGTMMVNDYISFGANKKQQKTNNLTQQIENLYKKHRLTNDEQIESIQIYQQLYSDILKLEDKKEKTPEELTILADLKEKQKKVSTALLQSIDGFMYKIIKKQGITEEHFDDVKHDIQVELLSDILLSFNVNKMKGEKILTYIGQCIKTRILVSIAQLQGMKKYKNELYYIHTLNKERENYKTKEGMYPSDEELTKILRERLNRPNLLVKTVTTMLTRKLPSSAISLSDCLDKHSDRTFEDIIPDTKKQNSPNYDSIKERFCNVLIKIIKVFGGDSERNARIFTEYYKDGKLHREIGQEEGISCTRADQITYRAKNQIMFVLKEEISKYPDLVSNRADVFETISHYLEEDPEKLEKLISHFENMTEDEIKTLIPKRNKKLAIELIKSGEFSDEEISRKTRYTVPIIKKFRHSISAVGVEKSKPKSRKKLFVKKSELETVLPPKVIIRKTAKTEPQEHINKRFCDVVIKIAKSQRKTPEQYAKIFEARYRDKKSYSEIARTEKITTIGVKSIVNIVQRRIKFILKEEIKKKPSLANGDENFCENISSYLQKEPEKLEKLISHFEHLSETEIESIKPAPDKKLAIKLIQEGKLSDKEIAFETGYSSHMIKIYKQTLPKAEET